MKINNDNQPWWHQGFLIKKNIHLNEKIDIITQ